ncbi:MAG: methyl-accepting chemotaxis protein, partial [Candidatus Riflebacteria bacterium]|nr:methyl-accepting chemotaxis protein [Candidatus Riflebacteria bacterium]
MTWRGFLPLLVVLVGIALTGHLLLEWQAREAVARLETVAREDLVEIVGNLGRMVTPATFFHDRARRLARAFRWGGDLAALTRGRAMRGARFFAFTASGTRWIGPGFPPTLKGASERCFALIQRVRRQPFTQVQPSEAALATSFLGGSEVISAVAGAPGALIDSSPQGVPRLQGLYPFRFADGKRGWLLADIDLGAIDRPAMVAHGLSRLTRLAGNGLFFGVVQGQGPPSAADTLTGRLHRAVAGKWRQEPTSLEFQAEGCLVRALAVGNNLRLFGASRRPGLPPWVGPARFLLQIGLLAGAFGLLALFRREEATPLPLRLKVILLFGGAAGLGVLLLGGFAEAFREVWREGRFRQASAEAGEILRRADDGFGAHLIGVERFLHDMVQEAGRAPDPTVRFLELITPARPQTKEWLTCAYLDTSGTVRYLQEPVGPTSIKSLWGMQRRDMLAKIGRAALARHNDKLVRSRGETFGRIFQERMVTSNDIEGLVINQLLKKGGKVGRISLGRAEMMGGFAIVPGTGGDAVGGMAFFFEAPGLARSFVQTLRMNHGRAARESGAPVFRFFALPTAGALRFTRQARRSGLAAHLGRFQDILETTRTQTWGLARIGREDLLIVGRPGNRLEGVNLYCLVPTAPIGEAARGFARRLGFLAFLFLGFAVALGLLFSETLLEPFAALGLGLEHLAAGRYARRVVLGTGDELQELGEGINEIIGEMKDLALARSIREALLPEGVLETPQTRMVGLLEAAGEGEDGLYDYVTTAEGAVMSLAARIPERGVAAGLRLGTMKMAVRSWLDLGVRDPQRILDAVERDILRPRTPQDEGTIFLGIWTPEGTVVHATRGRPAVVVARGTAARGAGGPYPAAAPATTVTPGPAAAPVTRISPATP